MKIAELFDVRGLATVVTGGANGIGLACAEVMIDNGARVTVLDRDPKALERATALLRPRSPDFAAEDVEVTDRAAVRAAMDRAAARYGRLDVVFANAGLGGSPGFLTLTGERNPEGAIENIPEEHWRSFIGANLLSMIYTVQAAIPHMKKQASGSIVVTTSLAAIKVETFAGAPYPAAKAGAAHLVRQLALELAGYNIRVNAIAPGAVATGNRGGRMLSDPVVRGRFENTNPMHHIALPAELQGIALYLASPASGYMTGTQLSIDGGGAAGMAD